MMKLSGTEPCDLDAVTARRRIGARKLSSVDLLESCITRIEAVNPRINAVVATCFEEARIEASAADEKVRRGEALSSLHGLLVLIKDLMDTKGLRTTYGSLCFKDHVPTSDATIVKKLRAAGANTANKVYGATGNPFDPTLTSGGSSGDSAAALTTGMAPLATGSDLGGSLRIPASFCSVVGMRPSSGLVPSTAHVMGFSPLWTDGPMARTSDDVALSLKAIIGQDPHDPLTWPCPDDWGDDLAEDIDLSRLRVGFSTDLGVAAVDHNIEALFEDRKAVIAKAFAASKDLAIDLAAAADVFRILRAESVHASHAALVAEKGDLIGDNVRNNVAEAATFTLADTAKANADQTRLFRRFQSLFEDIDVLICPATAISPFPVSQNFPEAINGKPLDGYYAWYAITWALSLMACPIVTLPCGPDRRGMPFGIQIVTRRHQDALTLRLAKALEVTLSSAGIGRMSPDIRTLADGPIAGLQQFKAVAEERSEYDARRTNSSDQPTTRGSS